MKVGGKDRSDECPVGILDPNRKLVRGDPVRVKEVVGDRDGPGLLFACAEAATDARASSEKARMTLHFMFSIPLQKGVPDNFMRRKGDSRSNRAGSGYPT